MSARSVADPIESLIEDFERLTLPKSRWTHAAHLCVGVWYLSKHPPGEALERVRRGIRAYNEAVGTANTDSGGYHETLTRFFLIGIAQIRALHPDVDLAGLTAHVMNSPLARGDCPLAYYSRDRLFSVDARRHWIEPDLKSLKGADEFHAV